MQLDFFQTLTIINSIVLAFLPLVFFRRQKLQEIKFKEIMELNIKTHDITKRADKSLGNREVMDNRDYNRLDYLISRYKKHSIKLSNEIETYKQLWTEAMEKNKSKKVSKETTDKIIEILLKKSEIIRELVDNLLK